MSLCIDAYLVPGIKSPSRFNSQNYNLFLAPSPSATAGVGTRDKGGTAFLFLVARPCRAPSFPQTVALYVLFNGIVHFNGAVSQV